MPGRAAQYTEINADVLIYQASIQLTDFQSDSDNESDGDGEEDEEDGGLFEL